MQSSTSVGHNTFAEDVLSGLSATPKTLSSKYFYDDEGSRLFREIMNMPEYYLTDSEREIFTEQADQICSAFTDNKEPLELIELGAGDGSKTAVLVRHFLEQGIDLTYSPIDISREAIDSLSAKFKSEFPDLSLKPFRGDYFQLLEGVGRSSRKKIIMFLGSNIGNFSREETLRFFRRIRSTMSNDDLLFIGFDLQKDPHVILRAYDDAAGITAAFNLNLLRRINRELGGNFDLEAFSHYALYRPVECAARSFLISREKQSVRIDALGREFSFEQWEAIFVEISQKYSLAMIEDLAAQSGFAVERNFFDQKHFYTNSLWKPVGGE